MYNVYVKKKGQYNPDLVGEYKELDDAVKLADEYKTKDPEISYKIEETTGHFDSYGEPLVNLIEEG